MLASRTPADGAAFFAASCPSSQSGPQSPLSPLRTPHSRPHRDATEAPPHQLHKSPGRKELLPSFEPASAVQSRLPPVAGAEPRASSPPLFADISGRENPFVLEPEVVLAAPLHADIAMLDSHDRIRFTISDATPRSSSQLVTSAVKMAPTPRRPPGCSPRAGASRPATPYHSPIQQLCQPTDFDALLTEIRQDSGASSSKPSLKGSDSSVSLMPVPPRTPGRRNRAFKSPRANRGKVDSGTPIRTTEVSGHSEEHQDVAQPPRPVRLDAIMGEAAPGVEAIVSPIKVNVVSVQQLAGSCSMEILAAFDGIATQQPRQGAEEPLAIELPAELVSRGAARPPAYPTPQARRVVSTVVPRKSSSLAAGAALQLHSSQPVIGDAGGDQGGVSSVNTVAKSPRVFTF